ncbi:MAG: 4-hydroxy-tetrahydrodipicolinate synthase [Pseudobdellovibrionaceae bacterium]
MENFKKVITALVTPFKNGKVDFESIEKLVEHQLENGIEGFVINGTTGESPTLTAGERKEIFKKMRGICGSDIPLIMGTGSNSTQKTIEDSREAEVLGADAILVVVPYYNKPPQRGLIEHFNQVADSVAVPTILYNVPGRTITSLTVESIETLSRNPKIIGIKEASGNSEFTKEIIQKTPKSFVMLSGDDGTYPEFMRVGGHGVISVASHVIPKEMVSWRKKAAAGEHSGTNEIRNWMKLIDLLFIEANPIPVKMALYIMGLIASPEMRLPLVTLGNKETELLKQEMQQMGLAK